MARRDVDARWPRWETFWIGHLDMNVVFVNLRFVAMRPIALEQIMRRLVFEFASNRFGERLVVRMLLVQLAVSVLLLIGRGRAIRN